MSADPAAPALAQRGRPLSYPLEWCLDRRYSLAVWASMLLWSAVLFARIRSDYVGFRLGRFDLGNMVQAVWSTGHGRPLEFTTGTGEQMVRLGAHVDPILVLLTPLWLIAPSPLTLACAQVAAVSAGALPVFWLARRHLDSEKLACLLALSYLAYPWLAWTAVDAMHPVTLAIPLLLFCVWFLDSDRLAPFALSALLVAMTGELMGITLAALGLWYALVRGRRWAGFAITAFGVAWTTVALEVVVPVFSGSQSVYYSRYLYGAIGGSPRGIARTAITDPGAIVSALTERNDFVYLLLLAAPLGGVFLLAPSLATVAIPQLVANGLAEGGGTTNPLQHYLAAVVPFLVAATVLGIARLQPAGRRRAVGLVVTLCVVFALSLGPWPGTPIRLSLWYQADVAPEHLTALRDAAALVPSGAPVSATNKVGSHLAARRYLFTAPVVGRARWIVLDSQDPWLVDPRVPFLLERPKALKAFRDRIERSSDWSKVFDEDGVLVFERT
jgi:uncharacterized membrane protein